MKKKKERNDTKKTKLTVDTDVLSKVCIHVHTVNQPDRSGSIPAAGHKNEPTC